MNIDQQIAAAQEKLLRASASNYEAVAAELADLLEQKRLNGGTDRADLNAPRITSLDGGHSAAYQDLFEATGPADYINAQLSGRLTGAALALNQELKIPEHQIPIDILDGRGFVNAETDASGRANEAAYVPKLVARLRAIGMGVTGKLVQPGEDVLNAVSSFGSIQQRAREQAAAAQSWTIGSTTAKPKRATWHGELATEDVLRLPGLNEAVVSSASMGLAEHVDAACFTGADADGTDADITGLTTATDVTEKTVTQAKKILGPGTVEAFADLLDGVHADTFADLRIVAFTGAAKLWAQTNIEAANTGAGVTTMSEFLRRQGLNWTQKGGIESATTNNKFGACVGLAQGIAGAAVLSTWRAADLIVDRFSGSAKGQLKVTIHSYFDFSVVRGSSFARLKFVS